MNNKLYDWLSIASNIAVLGGLILVAVQINQNTEITKAQLTNDYYLMDMQLELNMMGEKPIDSWIKSVYSPGDISQTDAAILDRYFNFGIVQINRLIRMQEMGLADQEEVKERMAYLKWHLGNEIGRRWWNAAKKDYPRQFVDQVDSALKDSEFDDNKVFLESLLN
ncbi:MAG: hypothetical protein WBS20_13835 [Lysobacterales bacterium]